MHGVIYMYVWSYGWMDGWATVRFEKSNVVEGWGLFFFPNLKQFFCYSLYAGMYVSEVPLIFSLCFILHSHIFMNHVTSMP